MHSDYNRLSTYNSNWFCPNCLISIFPFNSIEDDFHFLYPEVTNIIAAFKEFLNSFRIESNNHHLLFCLSYGKPASDEVSEDLLKYVNVGKKATETFIRTRLVEKSVKFHDTMKKLKLKTFESMAAKCTLTTTQKKTIQVKAERNLLGRLLLISQEKAICLEKLFQYPFVRKGMKMSMKILERNTDFIETFQSLGTSAANVSNEIFNRLQRFVCRMYGKPLSIETNEVHSAYVV